MSFLLILPKAIKSLNVTQGGKTWRARHHRNKADRLDWVRLLRSELIRNNTPQCFAHKVLITRIWGRGERAFDRDNLIGGCKSLVDAMNGLLIEDDSPAKCSIIYSQVKGPAWEVEGGNTVVEVNYI